MPKKLFKANVKPTQRDKTYRNKTFYELWFAIDKQDGSVVTGHCECIGGLVSSVFTFTISPTGACIVLRDFFY